MSMSNAFVATVLTGAAAVVESPQPWWAAVAIAVAAALMKLFDVFLKPRDAIGQEQVALLKQIKGSIDANTDRMTDLTVAVGVNTEAVRRTESKIDGHVMKEDIFQAECECRQKEANKALESVAEHLSRIGVVDQ